MDEIVIADYDPDWPAQFEKEAAHLREMGGGLITRIEHFGSTSVPGLPAKPIIDLLVGVASLDDARHALVPLLSDIGYAYWADNPNDAAHLFFVKGLPFLSRGREIALRRTHHVHMVEPDSPFWERLLFRDYLRAHASDRDAYAVLKRDLAVRFTSDREAYTKAKTDFIQAVMEKAKQK